MSKVVNTLFVKYCSLFAILVERDKMAENVTIDCLIVFVIYKLKRSYLNRQQLLTGESGKEN